MLLSDRDIRAEIAAGRLGIDPFDESLVQPSSVDVRLDNLFRVFNNTRYTHIDPSMRQDDLTSLVEPKEGEPFVLHPGEFVLGSTLERCTLPVDLAGRLEGKSSLGRLGLLTHSTAGFIDPGFSGHITLELSNVANLPITLWPGMKIGQLCLLRLTSPAEHPYGSAKVGSKYQGQRGPTPVALVPELHQIDLGVSAMARVGSRRNSNRGLPVFVYAGRVEIPASAGLRAVVIRPGLHRHQQMRLVVTPDLAVAMKDLVGGSRATSAQRQPRQCSKQFGGVSGHRTRCVDDTYDGPHGAGRRRKGRRCHRRP